MLGWPEQLVFVPSPSTGRPYGVRAWLLSPRLRVVTLCSPGLDFPIPSRGVLRGCREKAVSLVSSGWGAGWKQKAGSLWAERDLSPDPQLEAWRHLLPDLGSGSWLGSSEAPPGRLDRRQGCPGWALGEARGPQGPQEPLLTLDPLGAGLAIRPCCPPLSQDHVAPGPRAGTQGQGWVR